MNARVPHRLRRAGVLLVIFFLYAAVQSLLFGYEAWQKPIPFTLERAGSPFVYRLTLVCAVAVIVVVSLYLARNVYRWSRGSYGHSTPDEQQ